MQEMTSPAQAQTPVQPLTAQPNSQFSPLPQQPNPVAYQPQTGTPLRPMDMNQKGSSMARTSKLPLIAAAIAIIAGIGTGYGGYKLSAKSGVTPLSNDGGAPLQQVATGTVKNGEVFGVQDEATFKDSAEGYLQIGGLEGEGSHKLMRPGGESQTVYLTSSITDLDKFDGMEVKVWGETFKAQKAGWLMDVGRVQVVNTQGQLPTDE